MRLIDADALKEKVEAIVFGCNLMGDEYQCRLSDTIDYISDVLIEGAPTIGGWISCSERLPETRKTPYYADSDCEMYVSEDVLVFAKTPSDIKQFGIAARVHDAVKKSDCWSGTVGDDVAILCDVYAWMPLPEPYREDSGIGEQ